MRVNSSHSGHARASSGAGASGYPPRYPSESNSPAASGANFVPVRGGNSGGSNSFLPHPRQMNSQSTTHNINTSSSSFPSYDGRRLSRGSAPTAPELDLNDSTSVNMHTQRLKGRDGSGNPHTQKDVIDAHTSTSPRPASGRRTAPFSNASRDGALPNGVLLGSLAGYLPASAVALANAAAAAPQVGANTPHASSPRVNAAARGVSANNGSEMRSSRQSITVLSVTRDGFAQDDTRPPSNASMNMNGSMSDMLGPPAVAPRMASFNRVGSGGQSRQAPLPPRVQREPIAPIPLSDVSTSTNLSAVNRPEMPAASAYRQQSPQQQQQQQQQHVARTSSAAPRQRSHHQSPAPQPAATSTSPHHYHQQQQQQQRQPSPQQHQQRSNGELAVVPNAVQHGPASNGALAPSHQSHHHQSGRGAVLHHRPSPAALARHGDGAGSTGPETLQVSTTTLTKACKKVRYLLPSETFDPDAADPTDKGGLTEAEEEALLDPVNYTRAADGVAGRYPMLLRRSSAQGGDLLRARRGSSGQLEGPRPTFLLDDGNRWARETNRPTVATTRDPAGATLTQLPSPSILQKNPTSRTQDTAPFPAYQKVAAEDGGRGVEKEEGEEKGYLLQRHVQQLVTGRQLVEGTAFEPPGMTQRQRDRRQREEEEERRAAKSSTASSSKRKGVVEAGETKPRRGPTDGLYEEIIRRTNQNRRAALPTTVTAPPPPPPPTSMPVSAGAIMPPLAPHSGAVASTSPHAAAAAAAGTRPPLPPPPPHPREGAPAGGRRRGRLHPNSAEPTPLHRGSGVQATPHDPHTPRDDARHRPQQQQQQQALEHRPPPRSSSQPYITTLYSEGTPNGSDASGIPHEDVYYYTPNTNAEEYAPRPQQQQQQYQQYQQQQLQRPSSTRRPVPPPSAASSRQPPLAPPPQHQPQRRQDSPPPRVQQPPSSEATPNQSVASTAPSVPGYTSGRFSKYNQPHATQPLPPPPPAQSAPAVEDRPSQRAPVRNPSANTRPPLRPPPAHQQQLYQPQDAQQQEQQQQHQAYQQQQPAPSDVPRHRRVTASPPPADHTYATQPEVTEGPPRLLPPPPPQQQQQPQYQEYQQQPLSSSQRPRKVTATPSSTQQQQQPRSQGPSVHHATRPPPPQLQPQSQPAASYPSPYDEEEEEEDEEDYTYDDDIDAGERGGAALYPSDEDEDPVTDAAGVRTPRHHPMSGSAGAGGGAQQVTTVSHGHPHTSSSTQNNSSASAAAEVRRSLLDQYNTGDDENSMDLPRGQSQPQQQHQPPPQQQRRQKPLPDTVNRTTHERANLPPPPPPPPAATSTASADVGYGRKATPEDTLYEEAPSVASCDTETQPITVSERDVEEEEDDLVKKGPLVLKLGDEVYAEEGYLDEEDEEYEEDEEDDDDVEGGEEYWDSEHDERAPQGNATAQQNGSIRYGGEYADEL